jgi:hypothetical protein
MGNIPLLRNAGQKFLRYFEVYVENNAVFQNSYLFILLLLADP